MDQTARPIPLFLTALVALFSALAALAVSSGPAAHAHGDRPSALVSQQELALRQELRRLWEDHITWTRLAVVSLTTDSPDTEATVGRLLRNQVDIGAAVVPFYGRAAGSALTRELRRHILIAAELIAAARAGDEPAAAAAQARWERNADDLAALLSSANPRHWPLARMKAELRRHLTLTAAEVLARLRGDWAGDVAAYDRIHRHALHFADLLASGLVAQFPGRFR